jgi:DNA-binding transcriptional MerR regulator
MSTQEQKYFSIQEAAKITGLTIHQLRYLEKKNPTASISRIRGRRYYTHDDLNLFISQIGR